MVDGLFSIDNKGREQIWPLHMYGGGLLDERTPTIRPQFGRKLAQLLGLDPVEDLPRGITAEEVFGYIYGVFYSSSYRSRYAPYLKTDFPRVPLPRSVELFRSLSRLGTELVSLHLMESPEVGRPITTYTGPKGPEVRRIGLRDDTVWLDMTKDGHPAVPGQGGICGVPEAVWAFHIGGYQVCDKWLKDRKGRTLTQNDLVHYQRIIVALNETIRVMREIDGVIEESGGWPGAFADKDPQSPVSDRANA